MTNQLSKIVSFPNDKKFIWGAMICCWLINVFQHIPSFYRTVFRGDENVYISLSNVMGWDLSNYTTMYDPNISQWPNTIYRSPLFHHGPFYPYILKVGSVLSSPATIGFIFSNLVILLFLLHLRRLHIRLNVPPIFQVIAYVLISIAPLLLFSTTRLHIDAITGMLIASGFIATIEAFERNSIKWGLWAGLLLSISLNTGFTAILLIPVFICFQLFHIYKNKFNIKHHEIKERSSSVFNQENWKIFLIIACIVFTLGMLHYVRLFYTYGTILPSSFVKNEGTGYFITYLNSISMFWMLLNILFLIPILSILVFPETYRILYLKFKNKDWGVVIFTAFIFMFFTIFFHSGKEARQYANATPLFYCCLGWLLSHYNRKYVTILFGLILFSFFSMISSAHREVIVRPNEVFKIIAPPFQYFGGKTNGFSESDVIKKEKSNTKLNELKSSELEKKISLIEPNINDNSTAEEYFNLGYLYYGNKDFQKAIELNLKVIEKNPNFLAAYNNLGSAYNELQKWDEAIEVFKRVLKINPDYSLAKNNLKYSLAQKAKEE